jgi:hypothetical protein
MARTVFFSFHYQRDIMRVQTVKNHHVTKGSYTAAGFFDGSLEEKAKSDGVAAVKKLIDVGMVGSTVLCVLIGHETYTRRWVHYEIFKAVENGMGILGIRIHQIKHPQNGVDPAGANPFQYLGYGMTSNNLQPMIQYKDGWKNAPNLSVISCKAAPYLPGNRGPILNDIFSVYDWVDNDGYNNFENWVEKAAKEAGR